jgi:hypothetical protein
VVEREGERGREREIARSLTTATETRGDASADAGAGRRRHLERRLSVAGGVDKERVARRPPCARARHAALRLPGSSTGVCTSSGAIRTGGKGRGGGGRERCASDLYQRARGGEAPARVPGSSARRTEPSGSTSFRRISAECWLRPRANAMPSHLASGRCTRVKL